MQGLSEGSNKEVGDQLDGVRIRQELDDLVCRKRVGVVVEQIHGGACEMLGAEVDLEQAEQQGLSELGVSILGCSAAEGLCSVEVSLLVNQHLQGLRVQPSATQENGFLYMQASWFDALCDENNHPLSLLFVA